MSVTIRSPAPTSRQTASRINDADNGSTSSEVDISHISQSRGGSTSRGEWGKCGSHTIRRPVTATPIATPGRKTDSAATPSSPKSVLRVFMGSEARGISLCKITPTRNPAPPSRQEGFSLRPSLPKPEWKSRREPGHLVQSRQQ